MVDRPEQPEDWARLIKANWEKRAASPHRDYYVDSRPDYADPAVWEHYARSSAELVLTGIDRAELARWQVLDIGCGVGRLVPYLAPLVAGYTGIDIAEGMVEEARRRCAGFGNARFLVGDGLDLAPEAGDRLYDLVISLAVLIHNPRPVIARILRGAWERLAPGGQIRCQLLADAEDSEGIIAAAPAEEVHQEIDRVCAEVTSEQLDLIDGHYYMGDRFKYAEVEPFLAEVVDGEIQVLRFDLASIYAVMTRA